MSALTDADVRQRVESQAFFDAPLTKGVSTVLDSALAATVRAVHGGTALPQTELHEHLETARTCLDRAAYAHAAAAGTAAQAAADMEKLRARIAEDEDRAARCREEIARLEVEVAAERLAKVRRQEYDATAAVALRFPSRAESRGELAEVGVRRARLEGEERRLQAAQECVKKNFMLVMQSSGDLQAYAADAFAGGDGGDGGGAAEADAALPADGCDDADAGRGVKRMRAGDAGNAGVAENGVGEADAAVDTDEAMKDVRGPLH